MHKPSKTDPGYALEDYDIAICLFMGIATASVGGLVGLVMTTLMASIDGIKPADVGLVIILVSAAVSYFIPLVYDIWYTNTLNAPRRKKYALAMARYNEYVKQTKRNDLETFIKECKS